MILLATLALAAPPRLLLVGDTGEDTAVAHTVSGAIAQELARRPDAWVLALGDLFYDGPPVGETCVEQVEARYRLFYGGFADRVLAVMGNHDVSIGEQEAPSPEARACTAGAFAKMGWDPPDTHVKQLDQAGVKVDLVLLDAGLYGDGATPPKDLPLREKADWLFYADHYTWLTSTGKCGEAKKIPVDWLGSPPMDLWINGHAHHLEAVDVGEPVAITSGAGMQMREPKICEGVTPLFVYTGEKGKDRGGYIRLDLRSKRRATLTPVLCDGGVCAEQPAWDCRRQKGKRGVECTSGG